MDFDSDVSAVFRALDNGHSPFAVQLAKELAAGCDTDTMLSLHEALLQRQLTSPLVSIWRHRERKLGLAADEAAAYAEALTADAVGLMHDGKFDQATMLLHAAKEIDPQHRLARQNLASCLLEKGEFGGALDEVDWLMARHDDDAALHELRGRILYQSGDEELSVSHFQTAFDKGRASAGLWHIKALCADGRVDEAIEDIEALLERHPERAQALLELEFREPGSPLQILVDDERSRELVAPYV